MNGERTAKETYYFTSYLDEIDPRESIWKNLNFTSYLNEGRFHQDRKYRLRRVDFIKIGSKIQVFNLVSLGL